MSYAPLYLYAIPCGWRSGNFGDMFGPEIVRHITGRTVTLVDWTVTDESCRAELVTVGSYAQNLPRDFKGWVWGTGLMFEHAEVQCAKAPVRALRGKLTAARWPGRPDVPLGDPGLLVPFVRGPIVSKKRYAVGIVPHYVDCDDPMLCEFLKRNLDTAVAIDPCSRRMPEAMAECEVILSSSLHGLVTADALGIPNAWIVLSDKVQGGSFKFRDYVSAFGVTDRLVYRLYPGSSIQDIQMYALESWTWGGKVKDVATELAASFPPIDNADDIAEADAESAEADTDAPASSETA